MRVSPLVTLSLLVFLPGLAVAEESDSAKNVLIRDLQTSHKLYPGYRDESDLKILPQRSILKKSSKELDAEQYEAEDEAESTAPPSEGNFGE